MKVYRLNFKKKKISDNTIVTIEKSSELRITDKTIISDMGIENV